MGFSLDEEVRRALGHTQPATQQVPVASRRAQGQFYLFRQFHTP